MQRASHQAQEAAPAHAAPEMGRRRASASRRPIASEHYAGNQAVLRLLSRTMPQLQRKLAVGAVNNPLEAEADRVADQVMRMPDPDLPATALRRKCSACDEAVQRKCASCEEEDAKLQKKADGRTVSAREAPAIVHDVLSSPGRPLEPSTRAFFEPRMGYDLSQVRVHGGSKAAESATAVNALAYTIGSHIVFADGQYAPGRLDGNRLLAHELAHVVQQDGAPSLSLQRACRTPAQCGVTNPGSSRAFGGPVEAESEAIAKASGGVSVGGGPTSCTLPRHGERAVNIESLAIGAGLGAAVAPDLAGFFINACLSPNDGTFSPSCSEFPGGPPGGAPPDKACAQVHTADEDEAKALVAKPKPLNEADQRRLLWWTSTVKHESQHTIFNPKAGTVVPPSGGCDVNTAVPVPSGGNVLDRLTEISAEIAEYDVYFRNRKQRPADSEWVLQTEEHDIATRGSENILGNIKDLQCACNCGVVAKFVEEVFIEASSSWTNEEKKRFKKAMTSFMPSFWPRALHQT